MQQIKTTYTPVWISLLWSFILCWIPSVVYAITIATTSYTYDGKNLVIRKGVFTKHQTTMPIYRITDVQAHKNIFGYGTVVISDKMNKITLRAVAKPLGVADNLQTLREEAQSNANVVHNELF